MQSKTQQYIPGMYKPKRPGASQLAEQYFQRVTAHKIKKGKKAAVIPPTVCISRKIGIGALEIADHLSEKIGYAVADRQILEHIAINADLCTRSVALFDERYPGLMSDFFCNLFGEKSFVQSDYSRQLTRSILALAGLSPTVFVGRGSHLVLPRERTLAVRIIGSAGTRAERLMRLLKISQKAALNEIAKYDREQAGFFKKVYGKKSAPAEEFDLVINRDYLKDTGLASDLIARAFKKKFEIELHKDG